MESASRINGSSNAYNADGEQIEVAGSTSYYSNQGQVIQDGSATSPSDQLIWGLMNVNQLVRRDTFHKGATIARYVQQDANGDTTAMTDSSGTVQNQLHLRSLWQRCGSSL